MGNIRQMRTEDLERVDQVAVRAWTPIYRLYRKVMGEELFNILFGNWEEKKSGEIRNHFAQHPEWSLVTEEQGNVVGFITYFMDRAKKIGTIGNNAIDPAFQGRGLGTAQYLEVLRIFREKGMLFASVETGLDEAHAPARAAYEKVGFRQAIRSAKYYLKL